MQNFVRRWLGMSALVLFVSGSMTGCSSIASWPFGGDSVALPEKPVTTSEANPAGRHMAEDLLSVMAQLLDPLQTTVQVGPVGDRVQSDIVDALSALGYGVQRVDADQGANFLSYATIREEITDGLPRVRYRITIGAIELSRYYRLIDEKLVRPDSPMYLAGTRATVVLDDSRYGAVVTNDPALSRITYAAADPVDSLMPAISLITPEVVQRVTDAATSGPSYQALNSGKVEVNNLFYSDESSFGGISESYERVKQEVVVFSNDSMRLGETGKQRIETLLQSFRQNTDLISLVGCSNGYTKLDIGNEGLALGRSKRVTEELMSLGVARDQILDEGCWAPVRAPARFPSRGVVMELLRRKA